MTTSPLPGGDDTEHREQPEEGAGEVGGGPALLQVQKRRDLQEDQH